MEPLSVTMVRDNGSSKGMKAQLGNSERRPGDGMEDHTIENYIKNTSISYKSPKSINRKILSTPPCKKTNINDTYSDTSMMSSYGTPEQTLTSFVTPEKTFTETPSLETTLHSLTEVTLANDTLKTQLNYYRQHNDQLTEEKMRLSQQLGVQTQVNNEVKRLLIASIGEDLEEKYERLIEDKSQLDLELKHLQNVMDQDREEVEHSMIQADVWRSKFLASRVMSEELARWKSILYYKYKDSHAALQNLLHEHSRMRALNNATNRGLVRFAELLDCKDPSLDSEKPLTTLDVSFMNTDLVESLITVMEANQLDNAKFEGNERKRIQIEEIFLEKEKVKNNMNKDVYIEASELTPAEQLAQEIVLNPDIQSGELSRMRRDYLAHNRISHFLSTNYNGTFNCCAFCKGPIYMV